MKKVFKLFAGLVVLASVFMLSGCGVLEETYNKWYKYNTQLNLPIAEADTEDSTKDGLLKNADLYLYYNKTDGLKICFVTTHKQEIQYGGSLSPITVNADIVTGGTKQFQPSQFGPGLWDALVVSGKIQPQNPPTIAVDISDAFANGKFKPELILSQLILNWAQNNAY
ncbi:MAG: hypothetical protein IK024_06930 [Treponema sp.]|nr:hypothetical protein [Treponema sp.]